MNPAIGLITPVKIAFAQWLGQFYGEFLPDTAANQEWAARGFERAMAWVPARMVDQVEEMLAAWRTNDQSGKPATSAYFPVGLVGMAQDYTETPAEHGRPASDKIPFSFPGDDRSFRVRVMHADIRAQVVIVATDVASATSIVSQLALWAITVPNFTATYTFAGEVSNWPVRVLGADRIGIPTPVGEQICILAVDFTVRATMPLFYGSETDPEATTGFPVVPVFESGHKPSIARPDGVSEEDWRAFQRLTGAAINPATDDSPASGVVLCDIDDQKPRV